MSIEKDIIDYVSKTDGQWTQKDLVAATGHVSTTLSRPLLRLLAEKKIFWVGTDDKRNKHYNKLNTWYIEPVKPRKPMKIIRGKRDMIKRSFSSVIDKFTHCFTPIYGKKANNTHI